MIYYSHPLLLMPYHSFAFLQDAMSNGLAGAMFGGLGAAVAVDWSVLVDLAASFVASV